MYTLLYPVRSEVMNCKDDEQAPEIRRQAFKDRAPLLPSTYNIDAGLEEQVASMLAECSGDCPDILAAQAKAEGC